MKLNLSDRRLIENPDRDLVLDSVRELEVDEFAILIRGDQRYVQTSHNEDESWCLEYRDGSEERHFGTDPEATGCENACDAFAAFYDAADIASILEWELIDLSPSEPGEGEVEYNGVIMDEEWPAQIESAQSVKTISIDDTVVDRIAFGREKDMSTEGLENCGDCGVLQGQFHVPGCEIEQCPLCFGHIASCACQL